MDKNKRTLVTGAAGFMGSHLVDSLINQGYKEVYGVDDLSGGYKSNVNPKSKFTKLDLREKEKTREYIEKLKPHVIFHLAADATEGRSQFTPISCTERNYMAYLYLLVPAIKNGLEKMILTSSMSVYGSQKPPFDETMPTAPDDIYGVSKASMEKATKILSEVHKFKYVIIRPHNVYGPGQNLADPYRNVIGIFINCLLNNKNFYIYGDGTQKRAFSYIDDFTPYIIMAATVPEAEGEIFNIGPVKEYTINELAEVVLNVFFPDGNIPEHLKPKYVPMRPLEVMNAWCTADKAKGILGYEAKVGLSEGVRKMVAWAKKLGAQKFRYLDTLEIVSDETPTTWVEKLM
jgi:UDP-glucose 4-epimerase